MQTYALKLTASCSNSEFKLTSSKSLLHLNVHTPITCTPTIYFYSKILNMFASCTPAPAPNSEFGT